MAAGAIWLHLRLAVMLSVVEDGNLRSIMVSLRNAHEKLDRIITLLEDEDEEEEGQADA